jgi:vacuolar iron transporter family protein
MPTEKVNQADARRWRHNLQGEVDGAHVYRAMAGAAGDDGLAELYERMASDEDRHAALWREHLAAAGLNDTLRPAWRARILALVARRFGAARAALVVAGQERRSQTMYDHQPEAVGTSLAADERSHAHLLAATISRAGRTSHAAFERRHRSVRGNALRAAVLGANDGLVSNFCLVMGVAGASADGAPVLVAGLAGLLAGSLSMALGEWLSVQSARELFANQIAAEAEELAAFPADEGDELRRIYEEKGIGAVDARRLASQIIHGDRAIALDTMSREELGRVRSFRDSASLASAWRLRPSRSASGSSLERLSGSGAR